MNECPHCGKENFIPNKAFYNAELYGSGSSTVRCLHCSKFVDVHITRRVVVTLVSAVQSDSKVDSWGGSCEDNLEV